MQPRSVSLQQHTAAFEPRNSKAYAELRLESTLLLLSIGQPYGLRSARIRYCPQQNS